MEIIGNTIARELRWMGLQIAAGKTKAIRFRRTGERRRKDNVTIMIESTRIRLGYSMNYLGITVRDDWSIRDHLEKAVNKAEGIANNLSRLMVNKKSPSEMKRRLYSIVVNSVLLYGAPVWAEEVIKSPKLTKKARALQRKVAIRVIRAYRTVSDVLARNSPG